MTISIRKALVALGAAGLLGGCATGYYDDGYYGDGYYGDRYAYAPYGSTYYDYYPGYVGPSVGFGITHYDRDYRRYDWRRDGRHDWRRDDRHDPVYRGPVHHDDRFDPMTAPRHDPEYGDHTGGRYDPSRDKGQFSGG